MDHEEQFKREPGKVHNTRSAKPEPALLGKDRLGIQLNAYHQHFNENPRQVQFYVSEMLKTIGQPDEWDIEVGSEPVLLLKGCRVKKPGIILMFNITKPLNPNLNPTQEELDEIAGAVMRYRTGDTVLGFLLPPKAFNVVQPEYPDDLIGVGLGKRPSVIHMFVFPS